MVNQQQLTCSPQWEFCLSEDYRVKNSGRYLGSVVHVIETAHQGEELPDRFLRVLDQAVLCKTYGRWRHRHCLVSPLLKVGRQGAGSSALWTNLAQAKLKGLTPGGRLLNGLLSIRSGLIQTVQKHSCRTSVFTERASKK